MIRLWRDSGLLLSHAGVTALEIGLGMLLGTLLGSLSALTLSYSQRARRWLLPVLIASQAIPVFAIAPLLVLWLGYGLASKIAMATLIIYFPVTANFYDGLRHTPRGWLDLARVMAPSGPALGGIAAYRHARCSARARFGIAGGRRGGAHRRGAGRMGRLQRRAGLPDAPRQQPDAD